MASVDALGRALVHSPTVLLLEEPFSNLDAKLRERARAWVEEPQHVKRR
jgi:iron(III) transport system ATP-binding protein